MAGEVQSSKLAGEGEVDSCQLPLLSQDLVFLLKVNQKGGQVRQKIVLSAVGCRKEVELRTLWTLCQGTSVVVQVGVEAFWHKGLQVYSHQLVQVWRGEEEGVWRPRMW